MSEYADYVCSNCGAGCYYDGRCGDGPVIMCECTKRGHWIDDGRGGYHVYPNDAHPVPPGPDPNLHKGWRGNGD